MSRTMREIERASPTSCSAAADSSQTSPWAMRPSWAGRVRSSRAKVTALPDPVAPATNSVPGGSASRSSSDTVTKGMRADTLSRANFRAHHTIWSTQRARGSNVGAMIADVPHNHPLLAQFREDPYPLYLYLHAAAPLQWSDALDACTRGRYPDV